MNEFGQYTPPEITKRKIPFEMYDISGQDQITEGSFHRYLKDKEQDDAITRQNQKVMDYIAKFNDIERGKDMYTKEEYLSLFCDAMSSSDTNIQKSAIPSYRLRLDDEKVPLVEAAIDNPNVDINVLDEIIADGPRKYLPFIIRKHINIDDPKIRKLITHSISSCPREARADLIREGLENLHIDVQREVIGQIHFTPHEERTSLIIEGLNNPDIQVQLEAAYNIYAAPSSEQVPLREKVSQRIKEGLDNPDINIQDTAMEMVQFAQREEIKELWAIVSQRIKEGLNSPDASVQLIAADMIDYISSDQEREKFNKMVTSRIRENLKSPDNAVQKIAIEMIRLVPNEDGDALCKSVIAMGLGEMLVEHPLYDKKDITKEKFSRQAFDKTGSGTTLIGGDLKHKTILRHIGPAAFLTWQKIFEDYELWRENGFDYVPIEPIQSYRLNKKGLVDVYSGVLDLSLGEWLVQTSRFEHELEFEKERLIEVLESQQVEHGHIHDANFCLRFFRDEKGNIDFTKVPRIYLIDFDQAVS
ncbi:MAG: hypothetical protein WCO23_03370 [bacterium]